MKRLIFLVLILVSGISIAQTFKVEKLTGTIKIIDSNDKWIGVKEGDLLSPNSILLAGRKSSVKISGEGLSFTLNESSAIPVSNIKKMTLDELLLALAMEDILSVPRKREKSNSKSTAVYGEKEGDTINKVISSDDFAEKRLNGAVQLAENGFKESAVVASREIFRKYPESKKKADYRIYFANLLYDFGLYEEAFDEFTSIKELRLSGNEKTKVEEKLSQLNMKLVNR